MEEAFDSECLLDEADLALLGLPDVSGDLDDLEFEADALPRPLLLTSEESREGAPKRLQGDECSAEEVTTKKRPGQKKTKSNTWRQRQRLELLRLREEVQQLDTELKDLKLAAGVHSSLPLVLVSDVGTRHAKTQAVRKLLGESWEDAASRESLARQMSDAENERLRRVMHMQLQHARKLQWMLKQRLNTMIIEDALGFRHRMAFETKFGPPRDNEVIFQRLLAELDQQHGDIVASCSEKVTRIWINNARGLQAQFMDRYPVPFSVKATEQAVWEKLSTPEAIAVTHDVIYDELFEADSYTNLQSVRAFIVAGKLELSLLIRKATRKYVESGCTYFVVQEVCTVNASVGACVSYEETMWRAVRSGEGTLGSPSTIIETHVLATFPSYKDVGCLPLEGLHEWRNAVSRFNHSVEDALLGNCRHHPVAQKVVES